MNKTELVAAIAEKAEISKKDAAKALDAFMETVTETLKAGGDVQLVGFGNFVVREHEERPGINPKTKEPITIAAFKSPAFKAGAALKKAVK